MSANHQLFIVSGPEVGKKFVLENGQTLLIGRGQNSDTKINDPYMSRIHCRLSIDGDKISLVDASSGSLFYQGKAVESVLIKPGAEFKAGGTTFRYTIGDIAEDKTVYGGTSNPAAAATAPVAARPSAAPAPNPPASKASGNAPELRGNNLQDLIGHTFVHYRIDSVLAVGSTGFVFRGMDTEKIRPVAIKVLFPDRMSNEEERDRFIRAMKTMLPIKHPNLIRIYNAGKSGPFCWAAMEFVDGENLNQVIERIGVEGMLDWRDAWRIAVDIASALDTAFKEKIVHRNVTPANIIRRKGDKVCMLGDLMLAKALDGTFAKQVTSPGTIVGSLSYMPPERTRDSTAGDCRSDIYGLGATIYALISGRPPFQADSTIELIRKIREEKPVPPKTYQMSINDLFESVVLRMIAKLPDERYESPAVLLKELERIGKYQGLTI